MSSKAVMAGWCANLAVIGALNPHDVSHCASVLLLFSAVFFLFLAPLHAVLAGVVWGVQRAKRDASWLHAAARLATAESVLYWAFYWGMMLGVVPLHLRV